MPGYQTRQTQDSGNNTSDWQKMLAMYTLAGNNDANTMLGFALGKLLNQGWMEHLAKRHDQQLRDLMNRNETAKALTGATTGTPLGQVANANPYTQSYAQNYNDKQFSDLLAQGVASGKIKPEFAEGLATGGWNVGNAVPDYLKAQAQQTTQNNPYASLLGTIAPDSPMGKVAAGNVGNGITLGGSNQFGYNPLNRNLVRFTINGSN